MKRKIRRRQSSLQHIQSYLTYLAELQRSQSKVSLIRTSHIPSCESTVWSLACLHIYVGLMDCTTSAFHLRQLLAIWFSFEHRETDLASKCDSKTSEGIEEETTILMGLDSPRNFCHGDLVGYKTTDI